MFSQNFKKDGVHIMNWKPASSPPKQRGDFLVVIADGGQIEICQYDQVSKLWSSYR